MEYLNYLKPSYIKNKINKTIIYRKERWILTIITYFLFIIKCVIYDSYYALLYILSFYYIQNIILFITPKDVPSIHDEDEDEDMYEIPDTVFNKSDDPDEKPIIRKISEFSLWEKITFFTLLCHLLSYFEVFNIPVWWPMLLIYFVIVSVLIVFKQRSHMNKYNYSLYDFFKSKRGKKDSVDETIN